MPYLNVLFGGSTTVQDSAEMAKKSNVIYDMFDLDDHACFCMDSSSAAVRFSSSIPHTLVPLRLKSESEVELVLRHHVAECLEGVVVPEPVAAASIPGEPMDILTALQLVLRKSLAYGGLARGLHEAAKVIEKHAAQLCVLAEDCDQPDYVKLVKALCAEHNVSLLTVPSAKTLGEWAGLCKIDSEGKARKVTGCSCVVVKDFGEEHEAYNVVLQHLKLHTFWHDIPVVNVKLADMNVIFNQKMDGCVHQGEEEKEKPKFGPTFTAQFIGL
ncbi:hypothetical protein Lal_00050179 [Lupinus albus]|nr:hypothetical protein Lal_00050179 [Lupinus albus]